MATTTKLMRQGKSKQELFPLLTSLDDKLHYNLAWYHIFSKDNRYFLRFNVLHHVCLLLSTDKDKRIQIPSELFEQFNYQYLKFRDLEPYREFPDGIICNHGLISWRVWGLRKNQILETLEILATEIELIILDGINKIKIKELEEKLEKVFGGTMGTYEEHLEEGLLDEE